MLITGEGEGEGTPGLAATVASAVAKKENVRVGRRNSPPEEELWLRTMKFLNK